MALTPSGRCGRPQRPNPLSCGFVSPAEVDHAEVAVVQVAREAKGGEAGLQAPQGRLRRQVPGPVLDRGPGPPRGLGITAKMQMKGPELMLRAFHLLCLIRLKFKAFYCE